MILRSFFCSKCFKPFHIPVNGNSLTLRCCVKWRIRQKNGLEIRIVYGKGNKGNNKSKKSKKRKRISKAKRVFVFERDGYACYVCKGNVFAGKGDRSATIDHFVPVSRGGTNNIDNLKTCCRKCNFDKKSDLPESEKHKLVEFEYYRLLTNEE